jgi:hypothetical protein
MPQFAWVETDSCAKPFPTQEPFFAAEGNQMVDSENKLNASFPP